jgi:hypothetical protein
VGEDEDRAGVLVELQIFSQPIELHVGDLVGVPGFFGVEADEVDAGVVERAVQLAEAVLEHPLSAGGIAGRPGRAVLRRGDLVIAGGVEERHAGGVGAKEELFILLLQYGLVAGAVDGVARPEDEVGAEQADFAEEGGEHPRERRVPLGRPVVAADDEGEVDRIGDLRQVGDGALERQRGGREERRRKCEAGDAGKGYADGTTDTPGCGHR